MVSQNMHFILNLFIVSFGLLKFFGNHRNGKNLIFMYIFRCNSMNTAFALNRRATAPPNVSGVQLNTSTFHLSHFF